MRPAPDSMCQLEDQEFGRYCGFCGDSPTEYPIVIDSKHPLMNAQSIVRRQADQSRYSTNIMKVNIHPVCTLGHIPSDPDRRRQDARDALPEGRS